MKTIFMICTACLAQLVFLGSCNQDKSKQEADTQNDTRFTSTDEKKDAAYYVDMASGNMAELKLLSLGQVAATDTEIKRLSQDMIKDHKKLGDELSALAASKSISLPADAPEKEQKELDKLRDEKARDFNKKYISKLKDMHKETLNLLEKISKRASDPDLKAWADKTQPVVQSHLNMVEVEEDRVK